MSYTNGDLLEAALKRVNALAGLKGKLYHERRNGWYVVWNGASRFEESAMNAGELLAYLHGIEDAYLFISNNK